jgi:hypothetical protein
MRALCLCNGGNTRSSTLARMLRRRGVEALACGVNEHFGDDTILMLLDWCSVAYIQRDAVLTLGRRPNWKTMITQHLSGFPDANFTYTGELRQEYRRGYFDLRYDVGLDDWQQMDHPLLIEKFRPLLDRDFLQL